MIDSGRLLAEPRSASRGRITLDRIIRLMPAACAIAAQLCVEGAFVMPADRAMPLSWAVVGHNGL